MRCALLFLLVACGDTAADTDTDTDTPPVTSPDVEAELLGRLQADFATYSTWEQAPGWEGIVPTTIDTHGHAVQIFYNDIAMADLLDDRDGATSFKQIFDETDTMWTVHAITFDPGFGWFYAVFSPEGAVESSGDLLACFGCHENGESTGFLAPEQ